jgi:hypothetical protein
VSSKILTALFLVGGSCALYAGPVYSCGGGSACNGNLYAVWVVSQTATSYVLDVGIQVTQNYTGSVVDTFDGLAIIPDNKGSFTAASLVSNPLGTWTSQSGGLGASGCDGSAGGIICAKAIGSGAHLFSFSSGTPTPNTLIWQFQVTGTPPSLGDTANIQFHYDHLGGVGISNSGLTSVPIQCIGGNGCVGLSNIGVSSNDDIQSAPEPVTSALVGSGLIGLYFIRRRLRSR